MDINGGWEEEEWERGEALSLTQRRTLELLDEYENTSGAERYSYCRRIAQLAADDDKNRGNEQYMDYDLVGMDVEGGPTYYSTEEYDSLSEDSDDFWEEPAINNYGTRGPPN